MPWVVRGGKNEGDKSTADGRMHKTTESYHKAKLQSHSVNWKKKEICVIWL